MDVSGQFVTPQNSATIPLAAQMDGESPRICPRTQPKVAPIQNDGTISPLPWREATFELAGRTVRCAVASGLGNARQLLHSLQRREVHYEFVEIMACPGGCAGGGGQPVDGTDREKAADRGKVLFRLDQNAPLRFSHENPAVQALYREYLDEPCSHRAEELLHCDHFAWQMNASR